MNSTYSPFFFVFLLRNMIDQATIDRILDTAQIVDVVSEFVTLRRRGVNYIGLCPFHNEKTPSFSVSPSKGVCKCFSCGKGGNVVHFIMEHEQLSYYEALKWLAKKYNIEIKEKEMTQEEKQVQNLRESLFVVNQFAMEYFQEILEKNPDGQSIGMTYFRQRGFRDDIIKKFQLGYCTDQRDAFAQTALQKGYKAEFLEKTGLCYRKEDDSLRDRFWGRVIFPIHSISGKVVAFGGRVLSSQTKNVQMKYVNSPESEIYHKSKELYGIYFAKQAIVRQDRCFLVEGYTDVISMHQSGVENVVASSGTALTPEQIRLIHRFTNNITVLYDGDMAGIKASLRGIDMLLEEGMNVKICLLPDGDDPDSFARKHNATDFQAFINNHEVDFIRFKTNLLLEEAGKDPIKRASLISSIVKSIAVIPEEIVRSVYIRECSRLLDMSEKVLTEATSQMVRQNIENREKEQERKKIREERQQAIATNNVPGNQPDTQIPEQVSTPIQEIPAPVIPDSYQSFIPVEGNENKVFFQREKSLIKMIIRYGEKVMCYVENEEQEQVPYKVIEFIAASLKEDDLQFHNPLHRKILNEAVAHEKDAQFTSERFLLTHPDPEINKLAADMVSERYQLSKYHSKSQKIISDEERLYELIPRLLVDFKLSIVEEEMKHTLLALTQPEIAGNPEKTKEIMERYKTLHQTQMLMARNAGDRIVNPFS